MASPMQTEDPVEFEVRKRLPPRLPRRKIDIYVTKKTNFNCQMAKCGKLFDEGENEIYIHGLGAAVNRAITLALELIEKSGGTLSQSVETSSVRLTDDIEPLTDEGEHSTRTRTNSAIHIRVFKTEINS
ncbi:unnamed protein product [Dimorphilus gyrociliatus]|uniref:Ribonuclease P protein subunit p20 n=1 Tax=Dimorphilus gyrociliatus TaxID=2664684 RepID=A0A7I8WAM9_9ANNE|nr:unnamed protein product [Dimorphilus gyrociliatus]